MREVKENLRATRCLFKILITHPDYLFYFTPKQLWALANIETVKEFIEQRRREVGQANVDSLHEAIRRGGE